MNYFVGLDCGNSSFRTLLGVYDKGKITTEVIDQIPNDMIEINGYFYWDVLKIYDGFLQSLKKIIKREIKIDSIGVCTWGVDFALFGKSGTMLNNALSYRNEHGKKYLDKLNEDEQREIFNKTGIIADKINSVYLLQAIRDKMSDLYGVSDKMLMIPDIINYFLTGVKINEPSELSTTQIFSAKTKTVDKDACKFFGINDSLFCEVGKHGEVIGYLQDSIKEQLAINYDIKVMCVPSHDTASAIAAIPTEEEDFAFISSGTWALIGTELNQPIINDGVYKSRLTNEVGAFNKITLLKNSAGMFIIQRIKKEYEWEKGIEVEWKDITDLAESCIISPPLFNVNGERFFNPKNMSDEIWSYLLETKQVTGEKDFSKVILSTYNSMAVNYALTISDIESITLKRYNSIYIVGGGSKNEMLNKLTSKITGKKVIACSKESTALGNIATQIKGVENEITLKGIRRIIKNSFDTREYFVEKDDSVLKKYLSLKIQ